MKKIYLFLALAIAVAINANAEWNLQLFTWENGGNVLHGLSKKNFTQIDDYRWILVFDTPITLEQDEEFLIKDKNSDTYIKAENMNKSRVAWPWSRTSNGKNFKLAKGTYSSVSIVNGSTDMTVCFNPTLPESESYSLHTWDQNNTANVLNGLTNKTFIRISDVESVLVFETPITLTANEQFVLKKGGAYLKSTEKESDALKIWYGAFAWDEYTINANFNLAAGTYYSATIKNGVLKFNTYAETTTGLDALLSKAADYVGINTDIYVQEHHENYYSVYTTESSTYVAPRPEQDIKYYGDKPESFEKRDWVRIWAPGESEKNGKHFAAGTIVEIASGKAVKWGDVVSGETSFTPNLYRPLNFNATAQDKDVMYIFQPQQGEVLQVRGKFAKEGENEFLTDEKAEHKVALLGFTKNKMTVDQWYTLDGHLCGDAVYYSGFATATGVESVETANATVFAANGTINVSSDAQAAIEVYTANGQMVRAINADNASIAVAPGFYLVKVGNQVSKVVVK